MYVVFCGVAISMPIIPAAKIDKKMLAALLLPTWIQMQSHPTGGDIKAKLEVVEKALE